MMTFKHGYRLGCFMLLATFLSLQSCSDDEVSGCTDSEACNYNADATESDGNCSYICLTSAEKTRVVDFVNGAVDFLNANGETTAFAAFNDQNGDFIDAELYIFVCDQQAKVLAHGFQPNLIGQVVMDLQDIKGKYFVQELMNIANNEGTGWGWYYWDDPLTNTIDKKFTYVYKTGDLVVAAGTYK
jgi:cytochrome c